MIRILLLGLLLTLAVGAETPEGLVRRFYEVPLNKSLKGDARWDAVRALMTPRFYKAVREGVMFEIGGSQTPMPFDVGMYSPKQWEFQTYKFGRIRTQGDYRVVEVFTANSRSKELDTHSEIWLLPSGGSFQIDDVRHAYQGKFAHSYREGRQKDYQRYRQTHPKG